MRNKFLLALLIILGVRSDSFGQKSLVASNVMKKYQRYKEPSIQHRLFKHGDILPLIARHTRYGLMRNEVIGQSVEGRNIHHLVIGKGHTKVLLWSQMHGDESTATMALFDFLNFLAAKDRFNSLRRLLLDSLELHIVPMLNPDGAQLWTRSNAMKIDINRDAKNLATPEAKALMDLGKRLSPKFGFNLHDQSTYYAAGKNSSRSATISFLAPAFNEEKEMNTVRKNAVQVIARINENIQQVIPGRVAKYNDTFDARCFGDTFQVMGISTILIESGGYPADPEKQTIRRVNFLALLSALQAIADKSYSTARDSNYWDLPNNTQNLQDIIVRNLVIPERGEKMDLAINRIQKPNAEISAMHFKGLVVKLGDLSGAFGYEELDASGLTFMQGKTVVMTREKWQDLTPRAERRLIKKGILFVKWEKEGSPLGPIPDRMLNLANGEQTVDLGPYSAANFVLSKSGRPKYAVVNGYLINLAKKPVRLANTIGY